MSATAPEIPANLKTEHMTTAILRGATSNQADIRRLQQLKDIDPKSIFKTEKEITEKEDDTKGVNLNRLKDTIGKMDNADPNKARLLGKLDQYGEIIEGRVNEMHIKSAGKAMGDIPGLTLAIAREVGTTDMTSISMALKNGDFSSNPALKKIIERITRDQALAEKIKARLGKITGEAEIAEKVSGCAGLEEENKRKQEAIDTSRKTYTDASKWVDDWRRGGGVHTGDFNVFEANNARYKEYLRDIPKISGLSEEFTTGFSRNDIDNYIFNLGNYITGVTDNREKNACQRALTKAQDLKTLYEDADFTPENITTYETHLEAPKKLKELDVNQAALNKEKAQLAKEQEEKIDLLEKYSKRVDLVLDNAVKGYYNEVLLKDAIAMAQADSHREVKDQDLENNLKSVFDKYLKLSLLKYGPHGEIKGFDDKWIKKAAKSVRSRGPEAMATLILERIARAKYKFPADVREQAETLLKKINPNDPDSPWEMFTSEKLLKLGQTYAANVLGYAYAKHYWWDRIRFSNSQAEFIAINYGAEFWDSVLNKYNTAFHNNPEKRKKLSEVVGYDVVDMTDEEIKNLVREKLGQDKVEFTKKLLKVAPYLLAAGAVVTGGVLGVPPAIHAAGAALGAVGNAIGATAGEVGKAVGGTISATGQAVGNTVQAIRP